MPLVTTVTSSGPIIPVVGVPSMCPSHPLSLFQLLHMHAHPLLPTQPPLRLCAHLCTLLCTSTHLCAPFILGFPTPTSHSVPWHTYFTVPWPVGREILSSGQYSNLSSLGAYKGLALRGGIGVLLPTYNTHLSCPVTG